MRHTSTRHVTTLLILCALLLMTSCQPAVVPPTPTSALAPTATYGPAQKIGRPLKGDSNTVYRLMPDGTIRAISDWATFLALGYTPIDILIIPQAELASYPLGLPLSRVVTGTTDHTLYLLFGGKRYPVTDWHALRLMDGFPANVSLLSDEVLTSFPLGTDEPPLPATFPADPSPVIEAGFGRGAVWITTDDRAFRLDSGAPTWSSLDRSALTLNEPATITLTSDQGSFRANANRYDAATNSYLLGQGLTYTPSNGQSITLNSSDDINAPERSITALAYDEANKVLWVGTRFTGLVRYDLNDDFSVKTRTLYTTFNSTIAENTIRALYLAADGTLWIAMPSGVMRLTNGSFQKTDIGTGISPAGVFDIAPKADGGLWIAGEFFVASLTEAGDLTTYTAFDHPALLDRFTRIVLDDQRQAWFIGRQHAVHVDDTTWTAYPYDGTAQSFVPGQPDLANAPISAFPSPTTDTTAWLKTWPRPQDDTGRGMHYVQAPSGDEFSSRQQIARLQKLGIKWLVVNYTDRSQLPQLAPLFKKAGIMVIWRPFIRAFVQYKYWKEDVTLLRALGIPPYMQIYNEPSLGQEWNEQTPDQAVYLNNAMPAIRAVYDAGGYVGLQHIDQEWLRATLRRMKDDGLSDAFNRLYFIPHPYGFNHPPDYTTDEFGALGFRFYARVFQDEIGFVPMMIAGEGGWRPGEMQDAKYPAITEELHRDYHVAVFQWFSSGRLSDGEALPDYLFAFCPWLISDLFDGAAWYDSRYGNRTLTIAAITALPASVRHFSWEAS
ncbi:MAG: hypothetical protein KF716_32310 [Anaerolineae bacterium]|nr:hypothetical protein [Anaerolineae bacterium]